MKEYKERLEEYLDVQRENAKLKNRIKFIKANKECLTMKQKARYLLRYSPTTNMMPMAEAVAEGFRKGIEKPDEEAVNAITKKCESLQKDIE